MNELTYPVLVVADQGKLPMLYQVVRKQTDFVWWFNIPRKGTFVRGRVYDSKGHVFDYKGEAAGLRLDGMFHAALENILVPSLIYKLLSITLYFGPKLDEGYETCTVDVFQERILKGIAQYEDEETLNQIRNAFKLAGPSYDDKLLAFRNWIFSSPTEADGDG